MATDTKLGALYYEIEGRLGKLDQNMKQAKATVQKTATDIEKVGKDTQFLAGFGKLLLNAELLRGAVVAFGVALNAAQAITAIMAGDAEKTRQAFDNIAANLFHLPFGFGAVLRLVDQIRNQMDGTADAMDQIAESASRAKGQQSLIERVRGEMQSPEEAQIDKQLKTMTDLKYELDEAGRAYNTAKSDAAKDPTGANRAEVTRTLNQYYELRRLRSQYGAFLAEQRRKDEADEAQAAAAQHAADGKRFQSLYSQRRVLTLKLAGKTNEAELEQIRQGYEVQINAAKTLGERLELEQQRDLAVQLRQQEQGQRDREKKARDHAQRMLKVERWLVEQRRAVMDWARGQWDEKQKVQQAQIARDAAARFGVVNAANIAISGRVNAPSGASASDKLEREQTKYLNSIDKAVNKWLTFLRHPFGTPIAG